MLSLWEILIRLFAAVLLGGAIGIERRVTDHPAGLRTHILVTLAAATFMLVSTQLDFHGPFAPPGQNTSYDPSRIASYVVAGMGFLGAGSIMRTEMGIQGITTAASLWTATAIGLATGAGMFGLALATDVLALITLTALHVLELKRFGIKIHRKVTLTVVHDDISPAEILEQLRLGGFRAEDLSVDRRLQPRLETDVTFRTILRSDEDFLLMVSRLELLKGVERVKTETITSS